MPDQAPEYTPPPTADGQTVPEATPSKAALATTAAPLQVPGYEVLGELGRGGMGAVLRGRDPELGRELAVKVLLERHHGDARTAERFREEAQVGGQLQHPGVVPVYALGRLSDGRPFFTMKLVEGRTLAALLKERESPAHELPRFLHVFEQICQTLAYAHSRGVIHRDLKPLNVMVGAFGEVQVMDWGLAKVLRLGAVQTVRSGRPESESAAGSVLGTPAYMAPEQACGDVEGLDARCDVFGLGAVLCEILTGAPPYRGRETGELLRKAARADLGDAFGRLDGCGADAELVRLAKACLSAEASDRPSDAGLVASAVTAHMAGVQERLRQAELARAAAQAKAVEERKRRRLTLALAATVLLAVVGAGTAAFWYETEHARRAAATERDATAALEEATVFSKQAAGLHDDPARWEAALAEALSAVKRADGVLNSGEGADKLRPRVDGLRQELEAAERDRRMIARLEEARFQGAAAGKEGFDYAGAAALYAEAFRRDDGEWDSLGPDEAAARINRRAIREDLLAALADWSNGKPNEPDGARIVAVLQAADPDPASFRNRWNAAMARRDGDDLQRLAVNPEAMEQPTARLVIMGRRWAVLGFAPEAVRFLTEVHARRPGDFWVAFELANAFSEMKPPEMDEAIRYYTAALALRPDGFAAHNNLGNALRDKGRIDEAIAELRQAVALEPDAAKAHNNLDVTLDDKGRLDEAVAEYQRAIALKPDYAEAHNNLGNALRDKGRIDDAIVEYRKAVTFKPDDAEVHDNLGNALSDKGRIDDAIAEHRKAIALKPDNAPAHSNLANALRDTGRTDEALAECQKAIALKPDYAEAHNNLGNALSDKGRIDEALAEFQRAITLKPDLASAHNNLGIVLHDKGRTDDAITEYRKALALKPDYAEAHNNLGVALHDKGRIDEAVVEYQKAIELKFDDARAHNNLGVVLHDKGRIDDAITEYQRALGLKPDYAEAHDNLGIALYAKGQTDAAVVEYRKAIALKADYAEAHDNLGVALAAKGRTDDAIAEFQKAIALKPDYAEAHYNFGVALAATNRIDGAVAEFRRAVALKPDYTEAHYNLGFAFHVKGLADDAIAEFRQAIALKPDYAEAHCLLGLALRSQGRFAESLAALRRGRQIGSQRPSWSLPSDQWVREAEELVRLDALLPALLHGAASPVSPAAALRFAEVCGYKRLFAARARFCSEAFARRPALADDLNSSNRYNAACAAARAGCGQGEDAPTTDAKERGPLRKQARDWLRADLALWTKKIDGGKPDEWAAAAQALAHWQEDADLSGVRDADALAKLPAEEREAWRKLWADVDALLKKAQAK